MRGAGNPVTEAAVSTRPRVLVWHPMNALPRRLALIVKPSPPSLFEYLLLVERPCRALLVMKGSILADLVRDNMLTASVLRLAVT